MLGLTVPQRGSFYGLPWLMGEIGAPARRRADDQPGLRDRRARAAVGGRRDPRRRRDDLPRVAADRTSNGPHLYYPAPDAPGGTGEHENWILDNFDRDP